jgi:adenylyltransferase/sulfurtransferase
MTYDAFAFEITAAQLKERRDRGDDFTLLDVREVQEFAIANLGGMLIPLSELSARCSELDPDKETVVMCHHGIRSAHAVLYLKNLGFRDVKNLRGGIDRWSAEVDPSVPRY